MKPYAIFILFLLSVFHADAQNLISGKVTDQKTGEPLPVANVYIHNSKNGAVTDLDGNFSIDFKIESVVDIFISFVGYKTTRLKVYENQSNDLQIKLVPTRIMIDEKVISSSVDKAWHKNLKKFKKGFLGINEFGNQCEIVNPWILEFRKEKGKLIANSNGQILKIKNLALGYEINYLLEEFIQGNSLTFYNGLAGFKDLKTEDKNLFKQWVENRDVAYKGSLRHFVKSVMDNKIAENGFKAYFTRLVSKRNPMSIIYNPKMVSNQNFFQEDEITFEKFVKVIYFNELTNGRSQVSLLESSRPSLVYPNGELVDPYALTVRGQIGSEFFGHALPLEYVPRKDIYGINLFYTDIIKPLQNFYSFNPEEKIHIHTDKHLYFPGEPIWLKAYINIKDKPSNLSSKLFTQLLHEDGEIFKTILKIDNGTANGSIKLPDSLAAGKYLITAYTDWSDSTNERFHFKKTIQVGIPKSPSIENPKVDSSYNISLFPEGGNFISGIENSFAFEIRNQLNQLVNKEIEIVQKEKVIHTFPAAWKGMGRGSIKINQNKKYFVRVKSNPESTIPLPAKSGIGISVENSENHFDVYIRQKNNLKEVYYYAIISEGSVLWHKGFQLEKEFSFNIPKNTLAEGVNELVIFDLLFRPISTRLLYRRPEFSSDTPGFSISEEQSTKRAPMTITLTENEAIRDASIAVIDLSQTEEKNEENILINHYLKPSIKGSLRGLSEILTKENEEFADLLMMTRGWSRYNWEEIRNFKDESDEEIIIKEGFDITGKVVHSKKNTPLDLTNVFLSTPESGLMIATTDETGYFKFENIPFTDSTNLMFKVDTKNTKRSYKFSFDDFNWRNHQFPIDGYSADSIGSFKTIEENFELRKKLASVYDFDGRTYYLKDAVIKADRAKPLQGFESPYSSPFSEKVLIDSINLGSTPNTFDVLSRHFRRVVARVEQDVNTLVIQPVIRMEGRTPIILLDNAPIRAADVQSFALENIHSIEVLRGNQAAIFGMEGAKGAILINSRKVFKNRKKKPRTDFIVKRLKGYQRFKEFYSPDYKIKPEAYIPDRRSTLYWNPDINSETNQLTFYNHDNPAFIKVIMEGFTVNGKPFRQTDFYEITK